jgi:hypothetical protein
MPPAVAVGLLCLALVALVDAVIRHESHLTGDEPFYERMATHPGGPHNFPYAYRVVLPWLVHVLPFSHAASFTLLALLAIGAAGGAMYALLEQFDVDPRLAAALTIGFVLSPDLLVVLPRHGRSVDPASILVVVLGCLFIVRRQRLALAVTTLIGAGIHESSLFLIPLAYAVWAHGPLDRQALRDTVLVGIVPAVGYLVLRTTIEAVGRRYQVGYAGSFAAVPGHILSTEFSSGTLPVELRRLAYAFGPLWLMAPFAFGRLRFARRGLVLVALCLASMLFATDWGRIIFLAAPVFYVAAADVLRGHSRLALLTVIALLAVDIGYAVYLQAYGVKHGLDTSISHRIPVY